MSIKIYDGLRLKEGIDAFDLNNQLRELLNPVRDRLDARELAERAVRIIDTADFTGQPRPQKPIAQALMEYDEQQRKEDPRTTFHDPHRFSMSLGRDPQTNRILALPYFARNDYHTALIASGLFEEYGYWDNTDRPEEVTAVEWAERRAAWERVMPGYAPPVCSMLTFQLRGEMYDIGMSQLAAQTDAELHPVLAVELAGITRKDRARDRAAHLCYEALRTADPEGEVFRQAMESRRDNDDVMAAVEPLLADINAEVLYADVQPPRELDLTTARAAAQAWGANRKD